MYLQKCSIHLAKKPSRYSLKVNYTIFRVNIADFYAANRYERKFRNNQERVKGTGYTGCPTSCDDSAGKYRLEISYRPTQPRPDLFFPRLPIPVLPNNLQVRGDLSWQYLIRVTGRNVVPNRAFMELHKSRIITRRDKNQLVLVDDFFELRHSQSLGLLRREKKFSQNSGRIRNNYFQFFMIFHFYFL